MTTTSAVNVPDVELFVRYQANNEAFAFGELYRRYYSRVYNYAYSILKDRDEAYDLTEDTFLTIAEKAKSLRNPQLFAAWLFRIARNGCLDSKKYKQRFQVHQSVQSIDFAEETFDYEAAAMRETLLALLQSRLAQMPADIRELLVARYLQNKSISQLQEAYQLSESAVKMRLLRARDKMLACCLSRVNIIEISGVTCKLCQ
ncbi:MAG: RNA polymerase sigma factor [Saprospiraceae bacterium]|nr:RNA polymerase sigma factor [Saprospiraceae bacterium]